MVMASKKRCAVCGKHLGDHVTELIGVGACHPECADHEASALEADAAREMGCAEYYGMTGELPGDK